MGVFTWPGLEKRAEDFTQTAAADELVMCYVKEGSATLTDAEESQAVSAGQMVMVSDGDVRWSAIEGSVTLISMTTPVSLADDVATVNRFAGGFPGLGGGAKPEGEAEPEPVKDLDLNEAGVLLAAGLAAGAIGAFGLKVFNSAGF